MTKANTIGVVAAHPITTVVAGVNALALGVWSVNPNAKIKVGWTRTWYDPPKEKSAAKALLDAGADIVGQHQDTPSALQAAAEANKLGIGSEAKMQSFGPSAYFTGTIWGWRQIDSGIIMCLMGRMYIYTDNH